MGDDRDWLRLVPREKSPEEVAEGEKRRDAERGPYVPHHHHIYIEGSRH